MEDLSRQNLKKRFSFTLSIPPYLRDHFFDGKAVFPAVESLITLACAVKNHYPQAALHRMSGVHFPRLLAIAPDKDQQDAQIEIETSVKGISAALLTSVKIKNRAISRTLEHARVTFVQDAVLPRQTLSVQMARKLESACIRIPAVSVYRDLIPFGLSYQNIIGDLVVSADGALADISGGGGSADDSLLGSPFALDAAMHAACVWGQCYSDVVPFPVGFDERIIYVPVKKGGSYLARILPVDVSRETLIFDAWIFDRNGIIYETVGGLRMRDVTRGRLRPPEWLKDGVWKKS